MEQTDPSPKRRYAFVDMAKGLSIVLVVVYHAAFYFEFRGIEMPVNLWERLAYYTAGVRMPLFFAVSGMLAISAIRRPWPDLLHRKVWTFLWLFGLWSAVYLLLYSLVLGGAPLRLRDFAMVYVEPASVMWFLWALALFFTLAKLLQPVRHAAIVVAAGLAVVAGGNLLDIGNFAQLSLLRNMLYFLLGAWFGGQVIPLVDRRPVPVAALGAVLFVAGYMVPQDTSALFGVLRIGESLGGIMLLLGLCRIVEPVGLFRAIGTFFGRRTLEIYVSHAIFIELIYGLTILGPDLMPGNLLVPLVCALSVGAALVLRRLLGAPLFYAAPDLRGMAGRSRSRRIEAS